MNRKQDDVDYEPIRFDEQLNAFDELHLPGVRHRLGLELLRGLPFYFASENRRTALCRVRPGATATIRTMRERSWRTMTFAHRIELADGPAAADIGRKVGEYVFRYEGGDTCVATLREGFEIAQPCASPLDWGTRPSLAVPDRSDTLPPRYTGAFADSGLRQTEVAEAAEWLNYSVGDRPTSGQRMGQGWRFLLWSWANPHPSMRLKSIEVRATSGCIELAAICGGTLAELPLRFDPARVVVADVPEGFDGDVAELSIDVDRGVAGYTTPLMTASVADDPLGAWGGTPGAPRRIYARVSASPSATVRVRYGGKVLLQDSWSHLRGSAALEDTAGGSNSGDIARAAIRVTERGRNWVRTSVLDDASGRNIACRVSFFSPDGVPYQPYGHPHHVNSDLGSWHMDVGSDVRLGGRTYAYIDGTCEGWLPTGTVRAQVSRGFEYEPIDDVVIIGPETREVTLRLKRRYDLRKTGWYSGDTHVHFVSSFGGLREAEAEGVSVVNLLLSQWGSLFSNMEDFIGRAVYSDNKETVLYAGQENRQHFLGHLSLLGIDKTVMPWCSDGPQEAEMGSGLEATLSDWADRCHSQGGLVVVPHFPRPGGELASLIATERVDAVELIHQSDHSLDEYYRYLNAGFRLPIAGGTDKMTNDVPIGLYRSYVRIHPDDDFSYESWCDGLRAGRSFMSSGPLLEFDIDGAGIGDTLCLVRNDQKLGLRAVARSIFPIFSLEVIHCGRVIAAAESAHGVNELRIEQEVTVSGPGWMCARVGGGPDELTHHRDEITRAIMAHSSPIYIVSESGEAMHEEAALRRSLILVEQGRSYVESTASVDLGPDIMHHHGGGHREYLLRPFDEARERLAARLRSGRQNGE